MIQHNFYGNEVAVIPDNVNLAVSKYSTDDIFSGVSSTASWLPRLQLFTASNKEAKQSKIPINHYGLSTGKDLIDLGESVECLPVAWRPKAMLFGQTDKKVISKYNPADPEFKRIQTLAETPNLGAMFGPEFLVWVPAAGKWATLFMASKSARREAPNIKDALDHRRAVTMDSHFIDTGKYQWQAPLVKGCSTPFEIPSADEIVEQVERFNKPPESQIEEVEEEVPTNGRAR